MVPLAGLSPMTLASALERYDLSLTTSQANQIESYCQLLWEWNEQINLTRHTDYDRFVSRDLIDSMRLADLLEPNEGILDLGTGGGVPGIILAILRPDLEVSLCDSVAKKAKVVDRIVQDLTLPVPVHHARAEELIGDFRFDTVIARAVGSLAKVLGWLEPCWHSLQRLLLVKGPRWVEERAEARHRGLFRELELRRLVSYPMPGSDAESVILQVRRSIPKI